ncbi:MAG: methyl-accepting chemotaxis protein [Promethearchaeota archaeon]
MLQAYEMYINSFILLPLCFVVLLLFSYFFVKKDIKRIEFKVGLRMSFLPVVIAELAFMQAGWFGNSFLSAIILYPIGIVTAIASIYYTIKKMKEQTEKINKNTSNLEQIIQASSESSLNVSNIATELAASASEVNAASEEISATTLEVNNMAQDQVSDLDEMYKMANDIKKIAQVITSISEQTNLLALNASIEAGRAGEHGRGFAVVAEKVQKLAEESKSSVDETTNIIEVINNNISKLTENSRKLSLIIEGISASAEEQTASMEEITSTASKLGTLSEELKQNLFKNKPTRMK